MVSIEVNEVTNVVTLVIDIVFDGRMEREVHTYDLENVRWSFEEGRFILKKRLGIDEYKQVYYFNFPQQEVFIKYINPTIE